MNIAVFTDTYYPQLNGVTICVDNFARKLRERGHKVSIFAPKIKGYKDTDPHVYRLKSIKILSAEPEILMPVVLPHKITKEAKPLRFDLVHAHGNGAFSLLGYQFARIKKIPYVLTFHSQHTKYTHYVFKGKILKPQMVKKAMQWLAELCDGITTPSAKMQKELQAYGVKKPIQVIPNFVLPSSSSNARKGYLHKTYQIPKDYKILLSVGRLGKEKNFPFLIRAFKKIALTEPKTVLVIVGQGLEKENLEKLVKRSNLTERIYFTGRLDNKLLPQVYADSDLFLFASTTEVHPVVILEAARQGLPFVVVQDGAYERIIENGKNGYQVTTQAEFVKKILYLLEHEKVRQKFAQASKELERNNFDPDQLTDKLVLLYEDTIRAYRPRRDHLAQITKINKAALSRVKRTFAVLENFFDF